MFLPKDDVKQKVKNIIMDDIDNDIVFIVANKGIGKLSLLGEIYDINSFNKKVIIANGKRVHGHGSSIKKCYIDGICSFLERNNPKDLVSREKYRYSLVKLLKENGILADSYRVSLSFYFRRQIDAEQIIKWLSKSTVSIYTLKSIYVAIAGKTPLIIFAEAMKFSTDDREYLLDLKTDTWEARITYIIAIRASEKDIRFIHSVTKEKEKGIWVFPLLPNIIKPAKRDVNSLAEISLTNIGETVFYDEFIRNMLSSDIYYEVYNLVQSLISRGFEPQHIFFLANQEMSLHHYEYLRTVINRIYQEKNNSVDERLILPHEGKLLWLDALSYYLMLHDGIDKAIIATQELFFDILNNIQRFTYGKPERNSFKAFLKQAKTMESNQLAEGFALYFSSMAALVYYFSSKGECLHCSYKQSFMIVDILDKVVIQFSESSVHALELIHEYTQICFILDIGLDTISRYFKDKDVTSGIPDSTVDAISTFQSLCMKEAYKWNDVTLLDKIVELQVNIRASGNSIKIEFDELTANKEKEFVYQTLLQMLKAKDLEVRDIFMRKTIFLSYAHTDEQIANCVDKLLLKKGYDVKRDERGVKQWDSLTEFMQSIREQDYVVLLISDSYLHRDNCVYEVYQLLKDSNYIDRTFPIAIMFTEEEKQNKKKNKESTSMFDVFYWAEVLDYWNQYVNKLDDKLNLLPRELTPELDKKYRELKAMTQSLNSLFNDSFNKKLLGTIDYGNVKKDTEKAVDRIDEIIRSN